MPTTVLLVRHGATAANLCRPYRLQGLRPDGDLDPVGERQARAAGAALRDHEITQVYCSPLRRARRTAVLVADVIGREAPRVDERLTEADLGLWSDLTWPEVERRWPEQYRAFVDDAERSGYPGGENMVQVRDRVLPGMHELAARHRGETIAVVSHGVVLRVLLAFWIGLPLRYARCVPHDNGGLSVVELDADRARVRTVNAVRHLTGLVVEAA